MMTSVFKSFGRKPAQTSLCGVLALLTAIGVSGCARQEAQFSHRADYAELIPEAQNYVAQVLDKHFGTPTQIVAWERLPLKLHAAVGTVSGKSTSDEVTVNFTQKNLPLKAGMGVTWLSGNLVGHSAGGDWLRAVDDSGRLTFENALSALPAEGDRVAVGAGDVLRYGRVLYAEHCLHCHGVSGDANGPTAPYLNPRPRDFRRGIFKFTTTLATNRASRADLARTIDEGIPGTYMPSFKLLTPAESMAIIEYVLYLASRGEIEYQLVGQLKNEYSQEALKERIEGGETRQEILQELTDAVNGTDMQEQLDGVVESLVSRWTEAQEEAALIVPTVKRTSPDAESIARGRKLYLSKDLNCVACHGEAGLGDGVQTYSITKNSAGEENPTPGLYDDWGNLVRPRNLTQGIYRGGRRPIDLFSRLHGGIKGTPMPAFGGKKTDAELWDVVNYILSVPFEVRNAGDGAREERAEPGAAQLPATAAAAPAQADVAAK